MSDQHPSGSLPWHPLCPQCHESLSLHSTRVDVIGKTSKKAERVDVWFCIKHGFFRVSESQPITPGM
jgi:hypothetical protein